MRRVLVVAASVLALLAGLASPAPAQEADSVAPTLTVTPATDLVDGQHVTVQGSGWQRARVYLEQCEVGTGRCWFRAPHIDVDATGGFTIEIEVRAYFVSEGDGPVDCRVTACEVVGNPYDSAVRQAPPVALTFVPDAPLLPQPTITVTPDQDLIDGDVVIVRGTNFTPGDWLGYVECAAGTFSDYDRCAYLDNGRELNATHNGWSGPAAPAEVFPDRIVGRDGSFVERLPVYAEAYTMPGRLHCRVEACELGISVVGALGAIVARAPLAFDPDAPLRGPATLSATPTTGLVHHQKVTVRGSGYYGREPLILSQCIVGRDDCYSWNFKHPLTNAGGAFEARLRVNQTVRLRSGRRADCRVVQCVIRINRYQFAPGPHQIDLPFQFAR